MADVNPPRSTEVFATLQIYSEENGGKKSHPRSYRIKKNEVIIGRNKEGCGLHLPFKNLSKQHCHILIDEGEHFIMDLGSRNKTYRNTHCLRPNTYYELTNGVQLTLADISCRYFHGDTADEVLAEDSSDATGVPCYPRGEVDSGVEETPLALQDQYQQQQQQEQQQEQQQQEQEQQQQQQQQQQEEEKKREEPQAASDNITDTKSDRSSVSTCSPSPRPKLDPVLCHTEVPEHLVCTSVTEEPSTVPEGEDEEPMECPSPHLLAGNTTIPLPRGEDTREQEGEDYNDQTLAYDTSGTEGTVEGVANLTTEGGHTMPFDTLLNNSSTDRCGEQTVPYDGTAVCSSDAETQEVKTKAMSSEQVDGDCKSEKDRNEDTNGKGKRRKVTVIDPTIAYEMETDEEEQPQDGDQNMKKAIEPTVAYDLAEEGRDETERNGVSGSGSVGRATDPTVVYLLEEEEEEEESLETAMEGRVCEGKELKSKQREAIDPTVPYIIEDTEEGEDKEEEGDKDRVDPTVPYVAEDTESTEQGETKEEASVVVGSVKEEEEKVEKPRRGRIKRKDTNSVRGGKRHGRGRGRQEKTSGKALQEESGTADEGWNKKKEEEGSETQDGGTEEKIEEAEKEKEQELKKVEELEKGKTSQGPRKRGSKRKMADRDDKCTEEDTTAAVATSGTRGVDMSSKGKQRAKKRMKMEDQRTLDEEERVRQEGTEKGSVPSTKDLFDESPDIPTLQRDTPAEREATERGTKAATLKIKDVLKKQKGKPNQSNSMTSSNGTPDSKQLVARGRKERKRNVVSEEEEKEKDGGERDKEQQQLEEEAPPPTTKGRRKGTKKKLTMKTTKEVKMEVEAVEETKEGFEDAVIKEGESEAKETTKEGEEEDETQNEILKVAKKKGKATGQAVKSGRSSVTNTPSKSLPIRNAHSTLRGTPSKTLNSSKEDLPKVMFTGVIDEAGKETVKSLGGEMVESVFNCTHLVTDKVRRTVKFLCCLSRGCTIINTSWLDRCREEGCFIPAEAFIVKDKSSERTHKFVLKESIEKARSAPLLQGWEVFVTEGVRPCPDEMRDIIVSAGGKILDTCPTEASDNRFIISCEKDLGGIEDSMANGVSVCSSEVILTGVLRQQIEKEVHRLDRKASATSNSKRRRK